MTLFDFIFGNILKIIRISIILLQYYYTKNIKVIKNNKGFVLIYKTNGDFVLRPILSHKNIFRKMTNNINELYIYKLLLHHPHKNIVNIFDINNDHVDMELLNIDINSANISKIKKVMLDVKKHMHNLGIIYIDWKLDNIGIDDNGQYKLFDFNVSGLINIETNEWIIEPPKYWSYNKAVNNGMKNPVDIDNYAFNIEFTQN